MNLYDVLIVDDSPDDLGMTRRALSGVVPSLTILEATDGAMAIEMLRAKQDQRFRLAFVDLKLPKLNGFEVVSAMKADPDLESIPVVLFTSSDLPSDIATAQSLGVDAYLCKPMDWSEYRSAVCSAAERLLKLNPVPADTVAN